MFGDKKKNVIIVRGLLRDRDAGVLVKRRAISVVLPEGRPDCASAREMCRKLKGGTPPVTVTADNMTGFLFARDLVREVWLAYQSVDRKTLVCETGSLILAVLAKHHDVPVRAFPAEKKRPNMAGPRALTRFQDSRTAPGGVEAYVPLLEEVPKMDVRMIDE